MDNSSILLNIRRYRTLRKLSQKEVCEKTGLNLKTYQRYESGETPILRDDIVWLLAEVFGVSPEELLLGYEPTRDAAQKVSEYQAEYETTITRERNSFEETLRQKDRQIFLLEDNIRDLRATVKRYEEILKMYEKRLDESFVGKGEKDGK